MGDEAKKDELKKEKEEITAEKGSVQRGDKHFELGFTSQTSYIGTDAMNGYRF